MTVHTKLKLYLDRNVFKRGQYKGDAPLGKRWRTHVRLVNAYDTIRVRMWGTDILKAYEDGRVVLDTRGWYDRPTTKLRMNEALGFFNGHVRIGSHKVMGMSQPYLRANGKTVRYYDGIELDSEGNVTSELKPFERRQIDRAATKELREDMAACGFTGVFKVLHAASENEADSDYFPIKVRNVVTSECYANHWPRMVARCTWERIGYSGNYRKRSASAAWAFLMNQLRKDCYEVIATDVKTL